MPWNFVLLCAQTIFLWFLVFAFHRLKNKWTLIPLYAFISVLTLLTHNLSDLGFSVIIGNWFFLISSFSFFTSLMLGVLFLYLFEGPRAARTALLVIVGVSIFYIGIVAILGFEVDTSNWVSLTTTRLNYYFWSILAIILDVVVLTIGWELLGKVSRTPLLLRVFITMFGIFVLDTLIFVTGVFYSNPLYFSILTGNILTRLVLALIISPVATYYFKTEGFVEEKRNKPKNVWEIVNFKSDLEEKVVDLEKTIKRQQELEQELLKSQETYDLAITGAGAGIWDWNIVTNKIIWSPKFCELLGYSLSELDGTLDAFKKILHPDETEAVFALVDKCLNEHRPFETEYRLKVKSGEFKWFLANGIAKYNTEGHPVRMVGSVIDINDRKQAEVRLQEKLKELSKLNEVMVGRELKMVDLKKEIKDLKK